MATKSSRRASEHKRAERRQRDRDRARQATEALLTSEGWQRWLRARAVFHSYSLQNTLLLAHQCAERGITPTRVGGFRAWLKLGRCVRKGESALWVMAPMAIKRRNEEAEEPDEERRVFFRSVPVFELSQTEPLPGVEPEPLEPPSVPIDGDSHAHLLEPLAALATELGYDMSYAELDGACGFCDYRSKRIVIEQNLAPNAKVRVAVHELAHALGVSSDRFGRDRAEVIVECAAFIVCSGLGLSTGGESMPYLASWGEDGALEAITEAAELIDEIASRIEQAVGQQSGAVDAERTQTVAA
jgi:antirestriction protein ArdC